MKLFKRWILTLILLFTVLLTGVIFLLSDKYVPPILMYHKIDQDYLISKLSVSPESFERQMKFVSEHYKSVSVAELIEMMKEGKKMPSDIIAITFDDGYENNYTTAFRILRRYGIKATIFLIVNKIGQPGYLNLEEIKQMYESGLVDFGSHTLSHPNLTEIPIEQALREIRDSKKILEERLGFKIRLFSYPGGGFNYKIKELVKRSGYLGAVATDPGEEFPNNDIFALKRVRVSRSSDNIWVFWLYSSGYYTWIKEMRDEE